MAAWCVLIFSCGGLFVLRLPVVAVLRGRVPLVDTARIAGLDQVLSREHAPWRSPCAIHDPGKIIVDLATVVALGGDFLADIGVGRAQPELFGLVASDLTVCG
jgi:hypothetical protein